MKVHVVRAFCIGGARQEPGTSVDVPDQIGRELVFLGKAERLTPAEPVAGSMTTTSAAAIVKGKAAKEKADVPE
jgi:hypothetical protein